MIENHAQESLLIRFADGHATDLESQEAKALVQKDPEAAEFLRQLEATHGWLGQAAALPMKSAPEKLTAMVQDFEPNIEAGPVKQKGVFLALVATLVVGLATGLLLGTNYDSKSSGAEMQTDETSPPEWVRLVADYHALYARETISGVPSQRIEAVSAELSERLSRKIVIPELASMGLEFKRVQTLEFENNTLLQIAYLPESDQPIAICILAASEMGSEEATIGTYGKMEYAYWQNQQHAVVIVGEKPASQLDEVIEEVRQSLFPLS